MPVVNITAEQKKRFLKIRAGRPQDEYDRETFEHILAFYEGKSILPLQEKGINPAPVTKTDAFKPGNPL